MIVIFLFCLHLYNVLVIEIHSTYKDVLKYHMGCEKKFLKLLSTYLVIHYIHIRDEHSGARNSAASALVFWEY